jgi:tetratricopeptide (TPR) repeat protein
VTVDPDASVPAEDTAAPEDRWYLNDEREFLLRSLDDAEREHDAGDLSDEDHSVLLARDQVRLAEVEAALAALGTESLPASALNGPVEEPRVPENAGRSEWRRIGIIAACFLIAAGIFVLVIHAGKPRLPGQASSGSITVSKATLIEQQLAQAVIYNNGGKLVPALKEYELVLSEDPTNPAALAAAGWLQWNSGFAANAPTIMVAGRKDVEKSVQVAPSYYGGHLFLGVILSQQDKNYKGAVQQFNKFLADDPPEQEVGQVASLLATVYSEAGLALPSQLLPTGTTTTTPPSATTSTSTP